MMTATTNPMGRSFLSYRRTRTQEAKLLIEAQHDHGIPTWQDVTNLDEEPSEKGLRKAIADPNTASAILWITPDIEESDWIRQLEAPGILERVRAEDGFFVVPCCAGGVNYSDADIVIDPRFSLENVPGWNLQKVEGQPDDQGNRWIEARDAQEIARRVLKRRIATIHNTLPAAEPIRIRIDTRTPSPQTADMALSIDWQHRFNGRHAKPDAWGEFLLPALRSIVDAIGAEAPDRTVLAEGLIALPAAVALGASILAPRGVKAEWRQEFPDGTPQQWALSQPVEDTEFTVSTTEGTIDGTDVAVLVSVNNNVEPGFAASRTGLPPFREIIHVHAPDKAPAYLTTPGQATSLAHFVNSQMKAARTRLRVDGAIHLFFGGPAGLAFLIGQLKNPVGALQTYEFDPADRGGRYQPAALLE